MFQQTTEATLVQDTGNIILRMATDEADGLKQAFTLYRLPQWLPRLLQRFRHRGVLLHWH